MTRGATLLDVRELAGAPPGVAEPAFTSVSFELDAGTWLGVTGPNGCGKTTLALTVAGLWPSRSGTIRLGSGRASESRPRIATILQEPPTQITQRTVLDEIEFISLNLGAGKDEAGRRAHHWARCFMIEHLLHRPPAELSAGQQQLVLLAQALASEPDVLIADEAVAHLDVDSRGQALEFLESQVDAGLGVMWITQELDELRNAGRVIELAGAGGVVKPGERTFETSIATPEGVNVLDGSSPGSESNGSAALARPPSSSPSGASPPRVRASILPAARDSRIQIDRTLEIAIGSSGILAIAGPNGSGKTSLLEALAGISSLAQVVIEWNERPELAPILVSQFPERQIFEEQVEREVLFAATRRGRDAAVARAEALRLGASIGYDIRFLERRCWSLSAGEKRLLSLIGALIAPAPLVLLDEPTCGIDPTRRSMLGAWVLRRAETAPVVIASQDMQWIRQIGAIEVSLGSHKTAKTGHLQRNLPILGRKTD